VISYDLHADRICTTSFCILLEAVSSSWAERHARHLLLIKCTAVAPNSGTPNIGDGPNKDTYGYEKCVRLGFDVTLGDPIDVADCIFIAAKGK
jgi:hypothetical protein